MIVYYSEYDVIETFGIKDFLNYTFDCMKGMRNLPIEFKSIDWDGKETGDWKSGKNILSYEVDAERDIAAFRVSIEDENHELWTTDMVLNGNDHRIQLRLARERAYLSADYDDRFHIPYLFKKLIRDGICGKDYDIPISDMPFFINEDNYGIIVNLINSKHKYILPVVYVSHFFLDEKEEYALDVFELAKDLAGSAHVLVEKTPATSRLLKELVEEKNPYNGAVDIYFKDDSFRYIRHLGVSLNQFRYRIAHAIFIRMSMRNIDEDSSLSTIRIQNRMKRINDSNVETQLLALRVEELEENKKENDAIIQCASEEIKQLEKANNALENKVSALTEALNSRDVVPGKNSIVLHTKESEFYEDETKRFVIKALQRGIEEFGEEEKRWREYHILSDIVENNEFSEEGDRIKEKICALLKNDSRKKVDISELKQLGFEIKKNSHDKYVFHNDGRYTLTIANSPSDHRNGENIAHE